MCHTLAAIAFELVDFRHCPFQTPTCAEHPSNSELSSRMSRSANGMAENGHVAKKAKLDKGLHAVHSVCLVLDYGSQYTQLIARRVRENNVCSLLLPGDADMVRATPGPLIRAAFCKTLHLPTPVFPT